MPRSFLCIASGVLGLLVTLHVAEAGPISLLSAGPNPGISGQMINFDGSESLPGDGASSIVMYEWSFGDGSTLATAVPLVDFIYHTAGIYTASLRTTNNLGQWANSDLLSIDVNRTNQLPVAKNGGPYAINFGEDLVLDATESFDLDAPYGDTINTYRWDFGAGAMHIASGAPVVVIPWNEISIFSGPGVEIPLSLTVYDTLGGAGTDSTTLTVYANPGPAIPEPSTIALLAVGLFSVGGYAMRKRQQS